VTLRVSRRVLAILAINLVWLGVIVWSSTETLPVSIEVRPNLVVATVGQTTVAAPASVSGNGVGLFLQGADPNPPVVWPTASTPTDSSLPTLVSRLAAESAWTNVQITASGGATTPVRSCVARSGSNGQSTTGQSVSAATTCPTVWYGDWFHLPLGGLTTEVPGALYLPSAGGSGGSYTIRADLLRPRNAAGLLVDAPDGANGMFLYFRPEDRDIVWYQLQNGQLNGPVASAPYHDFSKSTVASVQDVLRELLGGYPAALLIVLLTLLLAAVEAAGSPVPGEGKGRNASPGVLRPAVSDRQASRPSPGSPLLTGKGGVTGAEVSPVGNVFPRSLGENPGEVVPLASPPPPSLNGKSGSHPRGEPGLIVHPEDILEVTSAVPLAAVDSASAAAPFPSSDPNASAVPGPLPGGSGSPGRLVTETGNRSFRLGEVRSRLPDLLAVLLVLAGLGLFLYIADVLLQRIPHVQDSVAYLFQAKTFALGRLWVPLPPDPKSFTQEFIVMNGGRWFSKYPPGWPMVLALGVLAGAPWVVDPILGALSLYLLYQIGREAYGTTTGLLAAALGLTAPFLMFLSGSLMAHTSGLFFTLLMAYGVIRLERSRRRLGWGILIGVAFGMLFLVRPFSGLMVGLPFGLYALVQIIRAPRQGLRSWLPAALAALPFAVGFLVYNKIFTGSFTYPPQQLWWAFDQVGFGPNHGPFGFTPTDGLNNTARNLAQLLSHGYGWPPFLTLSLAAIPFITGRARRWDVIFLGSFLCIIAGYACWWADGIMYGPRFFFEGFGFLILLTARGATLVADSLAVRERLRVTVPMTSVAVGALLVALVGYNLAFYLPGQWELYHGYNYTNRDRLDVVASNDIHNAVVFVDPGPWYAWWDYGSVFSANDPLLQGDVIYARDLGDAADRQVEQDFPTRSAYLLKGDQVVLLSPPQKPHPAFCGPNCPSRG